MYGEQDTSPRQCHIEEASNDWRTARSTPGLPVDHVVTRSHRWYDMIWSSRCGATLFRLLLVVLRVYEYHMNSVTREAEQYYLKLPTVTTTCTTTAVGCGVPQCPPERGEGICGHAPNYYDSGDGQTVLKGLFAWSLFFIYFVFACSCSLLCVCVGRCWTRLFVLFYRWMRSLSMLSLIRRASWTITVENRREVSRRRRCSGLVWAVKPAMIFIATFYCILLSGEPPAKCKT